MRRIPAHAPLARWEQTLQWALFLFILVVNWRAAWLQHEHDPYEFLRRGTDSLGYYQWLPCTFLEWDWSRMYWTHMQDNGPWISLFTLGVAVGSCCAGGMAVGFIASERAASCARDQAGDLLEQMLPGPFMPGPVPIETFGEPEVQLDERICQAVRDQLPEDRSLEHGLQGPSTTNSNSCASCITTTWCTPWALNSFCCVPTKSPASLRHSIRSTSATVCS